jgi:Protein of unknown function (DUF2637)
MHSPDFEQPQLTPQRTTVSQTEPAEIRGGTSSTSALETEAGTTAALTTPAQIAGRRDRTAAGGMDRVIRASTAVAVLALAGLAAYISYWHAYAVVRAHGESGITARLEPATIDGLVYASSMIVLYAARHQIPVPALAARPGDRGYRGHEHGPGLVTGPHRSNSRGLASGQPGRLVRAPGLADPHCRHARTNTSGI